MFLAETREEEDWQPSSQRELCAALRSQLCSVDLPRRTTKLMPQRSSVRDHDLTLHPHSSLHGVAQLYPGNQCQSGWTPAVVPGDSLCQFDIPCSRTFPWRAQTLNTPSTGPAWKATDKLARHVCVRVCSSLVQVVKQEKKPWHWPRDI